ncbi:MAG TPA: hypothetical protein VM936_01935 [Pyrinomonadaceae bacterium]|nr:hypothetical protein [Pyrinomonadaceae bacterium]
MSTSQRLALALTLAAALSMLLAPAHAYAQSKEPRTKAARPKETRPKEATPKVFCDPSRAVAVVETQLSEAKAFADPLKRIAVMTRAAGLLWPYERESARAVFSDAFDLASAYFRERGDEIRRDRGRADSKLSGLVIQLPDQRFEVIRAIARHDSKWARDLALRAADETRAEAEKEKENADDDGARRPAGEKLLGFAETLLPADFETALSVARTTFRDPATTYLPQFLYSVAKLDRGAADSLYREALAAYADRDTTSMLYLSTYPFALNYPVLSSISYIFSVKPDGFAGDPELQRQYVAAFLGLAGRRLAAMAQQPPPAPGPYKQGEPEIIYLSLRALEAHGARRPETLERFAALESQAVVLLPPERQRALTSGSERGTASSPFSGGDGFDELLEQAERQTNPDVRDSSITSAVIAAGEAAPLEKVEGAAHKLGDAETRRQLLDWVYFARAQSAAKSGALDDARKLAERVDALDERAILFLEIADSGLKRAGDRVRAEGLLDAVVAAAGKAPETETKARALLGVAYLYAKLDRQRALEVAAEAVKTVNRLRDPDLGAAFLTRKIQGKEFGMYMTHTVPGFRLENSFRELGALDFESSLSVANGLSDKYQRALAVLGLASKCLEDSATKK